MVRKSTVLYFYTVLFLLVPDTEIKVNTVHFYKKIYVIRVLEIHQYPSVFIGSSLLILVVIKTIDVLFIL